MTITVIEELERMKERYAELEEAKEAVENLLCDIEGVSCLLPNDIEGSHHAEMEWSDTLSTIESEMCEIENRLY